MGCNTSQEQKTGVSENGDLNPTPAEENVNVAHIDDVKHNEKKSKSAKSDRKSAKSEKSTKENSEPNRKFCVFFSSNFFLIYTI